MAIVSSVLLWFTTSGNLFVIFSPLYLLSYFDFRLLITPLVPFGHCIVFPSIYGFWLSLWYLFDIVSSVLLRSMASDYPFGIFWPLYRLSSFDLRLLITPLVSFGHCIVCPTSIYGFWLPLWYLLAIVSFVLLRFVASDYPFGIFWSLYLLYYFDVWLLIIPLISFGHCIVCPTSIYRFWLPHGYLLAIVSSVLLRFTASDYLFGIFWPLYRLSYFDLRLLITPLVSFGHCIVCPTSIYGFWLPLWYLLAIVAYVLLRIAASDYTFGILWPLYRLSYFELRLLITPLVSFGHCIVCPTSIYGFGLPLWYLLAIVASVLLRFTTSDYPFGIFCPLYRLSYFDLCLLIAPLVSFGHCIVCPTSIYGFWLPIWCLLAIVSSFLLRFTASDYPFGIIWSMYRLSYFDLRLLITPLVSFGHCIVCPSIYGFWLPLWYHLAIVSSVLLRFTTSDYLFVIFSPLYLLSYFDLRLLIPPLVSLGHCIVFPSIYVFWLSLWYLFTIVSSVLLRFPASDYPFGTFWPLYRLSFDLRLLTIPLVSFWHCIVCPTSIDGFWLPLWYLLAIVSSVLLWFTTSDYPFGIFWPLYRLSYFDLWLLTSPLVSVGHCIVCPTSICGFWLPIWYILVIVSSVLLWCMAFDYPFDIFWPLYRLSYFDLPILITPWVSFGHCIVCPTSIYGFWLPLWYLLAIVSSVLLRSTASDYPFGIIWPLHRLSYFDLWLLITPLVSFGHCSVCPTSNCGFWLHLWYLVTIVSSLLLRITASDYPFGIIWPLHRLSYFDLWLRITPLVSFGHCSVCPTSIYDFWLPLWYLLPIVSSFLLWFMPSDCPFGIFWPLYRLSYFDLRLLATHLVSVGHCIVFPTSIYGFWLPLWYHLVNVSSVLLRFTTSNYPFGIFWPLYRLSFDLRLLITPLVSFGHCIVCPTSIYDFWLPLCYLFTIVSSVLLRFTASDSPFGIFWPLYRLSYFDLRLLITHLVYFGHCIVCPTSIYGFGLPLWYLLAIVSSPPSIYGFWLPLWYLLAIVSSVLLRFMASDYPFGIFCPLYRLSYFDLRLLITPLVSFGHCIVCPTSIYGFWQPLWYLLAIVSSVLLRFTASDYPFGIIWSMYRLCYFDLRLLITPLVSFGHCIVFPSIYGFWLPLWYHLAIVSSVLLWFTTSGNLFVIFSPLYLLSYFDFRLLITPLVSFGHCIVFDLRLLTIPSIYVCPTSIDGFWLPLWYLLAIVSSVLLWFTTSDYPFGIFWPLYRLSYFDLWLLTSPLVSVGHCIVCPTSICGFWLPIWYILVIVSSVLLWCMAFDYPFDIFWPLYRLSYFDLPILITPWVSFGHCIVCPTSIYGFWLPLWYLLAIVSSVLLRSTASDYPFGIIWPLHRLSYFDLWLLITPLVSFGHCSVCPTSNCGFWLHLWYLVTIVSSLLLRITASDYPFGIIWPLHRLSYFDLWLRITPLVSFGHCSVCPTSIYDFWLPLWYLLPIVSSFLLWFMPSDCPFGIFWPLYRLSYFDLRLLATHLVSVGHCIVFPTSIYGFWLPLWYHLVNVSSVLLRFTTSNYPFGIFWPLYRLSFDLRLLITPLVSFGHCIVCPTSIYDFWLPLCYLFTIVSSVLLRFTASDSPFGIFRPLYRLSFDLRFLTIPLVSFHHCIFCPTSISGFWLPLWYLLAIVSSFLRFTASDYPFGIFLTLYRLSYFDRWLLITPLVSFGHCIVCPTSIYDFWLPLWYLLAIVSSVLLRFMASDFPFGICWPLYRLSYFDLWLLITPLVYFGHCIFCTTLMYGFWLSLWYLLAIVSSVLLRFTDSDYPIGIFWPLYRLSYFDLRLLITSLVSFGHCIVCPTSIYGFWLPLWYHLAIASSVLLRLMASDYPFGIFWPL